MEVPRSPLNFQSSLYIFHVMDNQQERLQRIKDHLLPSSPSDQLHQEECAIGPISLEAKTLQAEREKANFSVKELSYIFDGGQVNTLVSERRKYLKGIVEGKALQGSRE
jgi:hypothetical protein